MDFQQLEVLEEKIKKMITMMKSLQEENEQLTRKYEESQKTISRLKQDLEKWSKSAEENNHLLDQINLLKQEREQIRSRVEGLISHIEALEAKI